MQTSKTGVGSHLSTVSKWATWGTMSTEDLRLALESFKLISIKVKSQTLVTSDQVEEINRIPWLCNPLTDRWIITSAITTLRTSKIKALEEVQPTQTTGLPKGASRCPKRCWEIKGLKTLTCRTKKMTSSKTFQKKRIKRGGVILIIREPMVHSRSFKRMPRAGRQPQSSSMVLERQEETQMLAISTTLRTQTLLSTRPHRELKVSSAPKLTIHLWIWTFPEALDQETAQETERGR